MGEQGLHGTKGESSTSGAKTILSAPGAPSWASWGASALQDDDGLVSINGRLRPAAHDILTLIASRLGIPLPWECSVPEASDFAQQFLSRSRGQERLGNAAVAHYRSLFDCLEDADARFILARSEDLGLVHARVPPRKTFDYVLTNGSLAQNVRGRINFLAHAVENDLLRLLPDTKIVFLDRERPLFLGETPEVLMDARPFEQDEDWRPPMELPQDERMMNEMLWQQMRLPEALRKHGVTFVHAEKKPDAARA